MLETRLDPSSRGRGAVAGLLMCSRVFFQVCRGPMSYLLPHLRSGWAVDQAIVQEKEKGWRTDAFFVRAFLTPPFRRVAVVVIRFGHDWDPVCRVARGGIPTQLSQPPFPGLHAAGRDAVLHR